MAHTDLLKSAINNFAIKTYAKGAGRPVIVGANNADVIDQWVALHLLMDELRLYDGATCTTVTIWKELDSAWQEFQVHVHFDCKGNGTTSKKIFTISVTGLPKGAEGLYQLSLMDWGSPSVNQRFKGTIMPFTNNPGEDRLTMREIVAPIVPQDPTEWEYMRNPKVKT